MTTRRQPTPEEVKRINESLEALERSMDAPASSPAAGAAADKAPAS
jgi:hypothetical protein